MGELITEIAHLSKQIAPTTKTVVAGHKLELNFLKRIATDVAKVDVAAFDIYDASGIYAEYKGWVGLAML